MSLRGDRLLRLAVSAETNPTRARALQSYEPAHGDSATVHRTLQGLGSQAPPIVILQPSWCSTSTPAGTRSRTACNTVLVWSGFPL